MSGPLKNSQAVSVASVFGPGVLLESGFASTTFANLERWSEVVKSLLAGSVVEEGQIQRSENHGFTGGVHFKVPLWQISKGPAWRSGENDDWASFGFLMQARCAVGRSCATSSSK